MNKLTVPSAIYRASWSPNYMLNGIVKQATHNKIIGVTVTSEDDPTLQKALQFGITHVQTPAAAGRLVVDSQWNNYRWDRYNLDLTGGVEVDPVSYVDNQMPNPASKYHGYGSQLIEDGNSEAKSLEVMGRVYDKIVAADPTVTSPVHTNVFSDYFLTSPGGELLTALSNSSHYQKHRDNTANINTSRIGWNYGYENFSSAVPAYYTSPWGYPKANLLIKKGYVNSWFNIRNGAGTYQEIYDIIKAINSAPGRKVAAFMWPVYDASGYGDSANRTKIDAKVDSPSGILRRVGGWTSFPYEISKQRAYFYLTLGDGFMSWETSFQGHSNNPLKWISEYGGTTWIPTGGSEVPAGPNAPIAENVTDANKFKDYALGVAENGIGAAVYMYKVQEENGLIGSYAEWAPFTYKVNGGVTTNGYKGGSNPLNGQNGNARISNKTTQNYGEYNVVDSFEMGLPLVIKFVGANGVSYAAVNLKANVNDITVITLTGDSNKTITLLGDSLEVFSDSLFDQQYVPPAPPVGENCKNLNDACSANEFEKYTYTFSPAATGMQHLLLTYKSHEGNGIGKIQIDGGAWTDFQLPQTQTGQYVTRDIGQFNLSSSQMVTLASGSNYICFRQLCVDIS